MTGRPALVERAFQLAQSGDYDTTDTLRRKLKAEGYESVDAHVSGSLAKQLTLVCRTAVG